jgi:hypothetical protein
MIAMAKSIGADGVCSLTRKRSFVEAMALVLDSTHEHWRKMITITVDRTRAAAVINFDGDLGSIASRFEAEPEVDRKQKASTKLLVYATLTRALIIDITMDLKKLAEAQQLARAAALQRTKRSEERFEARRPRTVRATERRSKER